MRDQTIRLGGSGGRRLLVRYVQRVPTLRTLQLGRELDALRLYSGELGCRLTQPEVIGSNVPTGA